MKNIFLPLSFLFFLLTSTAHTYSQALFCANFESYESTPYFFRFGNRGSRSEYTYKPRWMYSHEVTDNPFIGNGNQSAKVLKYTSMEAKNYGLKFLFDTPVNIDDLQNISFKIYQPANVVGKAVESAYSSSPATKQNICIKILSYFNTVIDFNQEDGILLHKYTPDFTAENEWIEFTFDFKKADYASQISKFKDGVLGVAILPTYGSDVTLKESGRYVCYIDDIIVNKSASSVDALHAGDMSVLYADGNLQFSFAEAGIYTISVFDMSGRETANHTSYISSNYSLPIHLPENTYIVKADLNNRTFRQKIVVR